MTDPAPAPGGDPAVGVTDNPSLHRFEVRVGDELAGFADYERRGDAVAFVHTETASGFEGRGLASTLVRGALDAMRERTTPVLPFCPFVRTYIARHPAYLDLVPADQRHRFDLE